MSLNLRRSIAKSLAVTALLCLTPSGVASAQDPDPVAVCVKPSTQMQQYCVVIHP